MRQLNFVLIVLVVFACCGCSTVDKAQIASTLHGIDAYAMTFQLGLAENDPLVEDIAELRDKGEPVIKAVDAWAESDTAEDPAQQVWELLAAVDGVLEDKLEGTQLTTAKRIIAGVRLALLSNGLSPPVNDGGDQ